MVRTTILFCMAILISMNSFALAQSESNEPFELNGEFLLWTLEEVIMVFGEPYSESQVLVGDYFIFNRYDFGDFIISSWDRYPNQVTSIVVLRGSSISLLGILNIGDRLVDVLTMTGKEGLTMRSKGNGIYKIYLPDIQNQNEYASPSVTLKFEDNLLVQYSLSEDL
jgi:hypothetical protein